jgi:hypothetical protein
VEAQTMRKSKDYEGTIFDVETIKESLSLWSKYLVDVKSQTLSINKGGEEWHYDDENEFFSDYRKGFWSMSLYKIKTPYTLSINVYRGENTTISAESPMRSEIEQLFDIFEKNVNKCKLPPKPKPKPVIFIGHGRSGQWRDLKDHLQDKHGYEIQAFEIGARAGHTIRDILQEILIKSSFAVLVMTGEDQMRDKKLRARQNVIHEAGLFQGRFGFSRAIILLEKGAQEFSNIHGINQIRYSKGNIKETFGEILATLKREFGI